VILNVFKERYQCCVIFACFLCCVLGVFNPGAISVHGLLGLSRSLRLTCMLCIFVPPPTLSHFRKLLTRDRFFGLCHCSYIWVPCLPFCVMLQMTWIKQYVSW